MFSSRNLSNFLAVVWPLSCFYQSCLLMISSCFLNLACLQPQLMFSLAGKSRWPKVVVCAQEPRTFWGRNVLVEKFWGLRIAPQASRQVWSGYCKLWHNTFHPTAFSLRHNVESFPKINNPFLHLVPVTMPLSAVLNCGPFSLLCL